MHDNGNWRQITLTSRRHYASIARELREHCAERHYTVSSVCLLAKIKAVSTSNFLSLHGEKLKYMYTGYIQNEKSMVGQKKFAIFSKRLQEARSHYKDKAFGTISVVLLGDFKQLLSVCDAPLFKANGINPSGYNKYQLFDKSITFTELV